MANVLCYCISWYAIAKSAIGPAPQAVTENSEVEENTSCLQHVYSKVALQASVLGPECELYANHHFMQGQQLGFRVYSWLQDA